ncbi:hypothetical protein MKJ04_09480 [Pontibacter sp. E15-1]|uniref:hypothetical protein n=1 Tax=Pontibacter sp. E15-1 TaxID=2919918 RepID=UPI001F4F4ED9|nr:hypothetical protein [Pontibacter sp. E15-1]MCJ8165074.1 hypothetical protein [Pontibacter sp. E15-1]
MSACLNFFFWQRELFGVGSDKAFFKQQSDGIEAPKNCFRFYFGQFATQKMNFTQALSILGGAWMLTHKNLNSTAMGKSQDSKKEVKKKPAKTEKEKRAAKQEKKKGKE